MEHEQGSGNPGVRLNVCPVLQSLWVERTTLTLVQSLPGISRWFEVDKRELVRSHPHLVFFQLAVFTSRSGWVSIGVAPDDGGWEFRSVCFISLADQFCSRP